MHYFFIRSLIELHISSIFQKKLSFTKNVKVYLLCDADESQFVFSVFPGNKNLKVMFKSILPLPGESSDGNFNNFERKLTLRI